MKSFKILFSLALLLSFASCVEKTVIIETDDSVVVDPNDDTNSGTSDNDGDGVTNQQEAVDNTDPDDPCSVNLSSQYVPSITDAWNALDCDGDGVTNGQERADFTQLLDPYLGHGCDYVIEHQDPNLVSDLWKSFDCDGDGVDNGIELLTDNTDPHDPCSLVITSQEITDGMGWLAQDCDGDGRNNGMEIEAGTDPLDPNSFPGSGTKLVSAVIGENGWRNLFFSHEGTRFDRILNTDGSLCTEFTYNAQGQLTQVFVKDDDGPDDLTIDYTYTGDLITKVDIDHGGDLTVMDVVHEGNTVKTFESDADLPDGIFKRRFTFDPVTNKLVLMETFRRVSSNVLNHESEEFFYDGPDGDINRSHSTRQGYNIATQTFYTQGVEPVPTTEIYNYAEGTVKNPLRAAAEPIYMNYLLTPIIFAKTWVRYHGAFSQNFRESYSYYQPGLDYGYYNISETVQANGYPITGTTEIYLWSPIPIEFYYEE
jgi:hypothetical protein